MSTHLGSSFGPLDLDELRGTHRAAVEEHLRSCLRCAEQYRRTADALSSVPLSLSSPKAGPSLWEAVERELRFEEFVPRVARLLDVGASRAREMLALLDDRARWTLGPAPGCTLLHVGGGPRVAGAITAFVRLEPRAEFPRHRHLGRERALVLQGSYSSEGRVARAGEEVEMPAGSEHALTAMSGPPLMYLAVVDVGVDLGDGQVIGAADPL